MDRRPLERILHQDFSSCGFFWTQVFPSGVTFKICVESPKHVQPICVYDQLLNQVIKLNNVISQGDNSDYFPDNGVKMLSPCNFPMVVVGSHRGNHFKQIFRLYSSQYNQIGISLFIGCFTYPYGFKQACRRLDF